MDTFNKDPVVEDDLYHIKQYVECIQMKGLEKVEGGTDFKPEQEKPTNTANLSITSIFKHL